MMSNKHYETPKRELLVFYYKYRRRLIVAFLLPFLLSVAVSFVPTPRYESTSSVVVRLGPEYVYQSEIGAGTNSPASPIPFDRDQIYKAEVAILSSHDLHQQVVEAIGLDRMYPQHKGSHKWLAPFSDWSLGVLERWFPEYDEHTPELVESLRSWLSAYDADAQMSDQDRARKNLDIATENFDKRLEVLLGKETAVINLSFQHKDREISVKALDTLLQLYMEKRKQLYLETRSDLAKDEADAIRRRAARAQGAVEAFKRQHQIYSLADQRVQLLAQREDLRKQMMTISNIALEDKMLSITDQLDKLDALEREYNSLQHDVDVTNEEDTLYNHKLNEAQDYDKLARGRAGSVLVVQPPAAPPEPKRLQNMIILAGLILSFMFTVLVAAFTEFSRSGFLTPERLERNVGLPILGVLPLRK